MAAARVIHFGVDTCYRLGILRRAGYEIEECGNLIQFHTAVQSDPDAVMVNDSVGSVPLDAFRIARSNTSAPIILFPNSLRDYEIEKVDLVVPSFTPPQDWLLDIANLIVHFRAVRAYSEALWAQSELLRSESRAVREKSRRERQRSRDLINANFRFDPNRRSDPE